MRRWLLFGFALGVAGVTAMVAWIGFGPVLAAVARIGLRGLGLLVLYSALPYSLLGTAWFSLDAPWRASRWPGFIWARMVRDASGELLPFSHAGGLVIGVRAAVLQGMSTAWATASTVVDVTAELIAQIGFTGLGLAILVLHRESAPAGGSLQAAAGVGLGLTAIAATGFIALQRRGVGLAATLTARFLPSVAGSAAETADLIGRLYRRPGRFLLAGTLHLAAWMASALGVWLALHLAGARIDPLAVLGLEALVMAIRSAAFLAPMGIGVQEASYVLLGPVFGVGSDVALALSLIKRARELAVGLPVLALWQAEESRRWLRPGSGADAV